MSTTQLVSGSEATPKKRQRRSSRANSSDIDVEKPKKKKKKTKRQLSPETAILVSWHGCIASFHSFGHITGHFEFVIDQ